MHAVGSPIGEAGADNPRASLRGSTGEPRAGLPGSDGRGARSCAGSPATGHVQQALES